MLINLIIFKDYGVNKIKIVRNKIVKKLRGLSFRKKILFSVVCFAAAGLIVVAFIMPQDKKSPDPKESEPNPKGSLIEERKVTGGDPAQLIKYHEDAVAAWRTGDKERAKELAQKGLDLNDQLTNDQLMSIQDQPDKIYDMSDILRGSYEEE